MGKPGTAVPGEKMGEPNEPHRDGTGSHAHSESRDVRSEIYLAANASATRRSARIARRIDRFVNDLPIPGSLLKNSRMHARP